MEKGTVIINISDIFDLNDQLKDRDKIIANIAQDRQHEELELNHLRKQKEELEKLYKQNRHEIDALKDRRHAESIYLYVKEYDHKRRIKYIPEDVFNEAFEKFLDELGTKYRDANDDLPL